MFVHNADKTTEAGIFLFQQGMQFAQSRTLRADGFAVFQVGESCLPSKSPTFFRRPMWHQWHLC